MMPALPVVPPLIPIGQALPLTHADYIAICTRIARERREVPTVRVQIRKKGEVFCGVVREMATMRNRQWFAVETEIHGRAWVESHNVRLCNCSASGRCNCEDDAAELEVLG